VPPTHRIPFRRAGRNPTTLRTGGLGLLARTAWQREVAMGAVTPALWIGFGWLIHGFMVTAAAISAEDLPTVAGRRVSASSPSWAGSC
jgi:hypothetical protein